MTWLYQVRHTLPLIQSLRGELIRLMCFFLLIFQVDYIMYQSVTFNPCCHYNKFTQSVSRKTTYNLYTYSSYSCKTKPLHSGFGIFCGVFYLFLLRFYCFLFILMNGNLDKTFVFIPLVIWIKNTRCPSFYSG